MLRIRPSGCKRFVDFCLPAYRLFAMCRHLQSLALACCLATPAIADETIDLHAFSDLVHRGASLTDGNPGLGVSASWDFPSGWFVGGGGHYAGGTPSGRQLTRGVHAYAGWFKTLSNERALELSLNRVEFIDVSNWSYTEIRADYHARPELGLTLAWSPDYYGRAETLNAGVSWRPRLGTNAYALLAGGVGYVGDSVDDTTSWGQAGLGFNVQRFDIALSFNAVDRTTERVFLRPRETLALTVSYRLR